MLNRRQLKGKNKTSEAGPESGNAPSQGTGAGQAQGPSKNPNPGRNQQGQNQRSEEHTSELQSRLHLVCRLLLEKKKIKELTDIVAAAAGDPGLKERTWVLLTESPEGGCGINGHANTCTDLVQAAHDSLAARKA